MIRPEQADERATFWPHEEQIIACIEVAYGLSIRQCQKLPLGADSEAAVYQLHSRRHKSYFLKLRRHGFMETSLSVPAFLRQSCGLTVIPAVIPSRQGKLSLQRLGLTWILYSLIEGQDGFTQTLSPTQWHNLGGAVAAMHTASLPVELAQAIPVEDFSPCFRMAVRSFLAQLPVVQQEDSPGRAFLACCRAEQNRITRLLTRAEALAAWLAHRAPAFVLCHGDLHAGNIMLDAVGKLWIVDWDNLIFAPKECDLMCIGGGIGGIWNTGAEETLFYQGYGDARPDLPTLCYYRCERIIRDIGEFILLMTGREASSSERDEAAARMSSQFQPGNVFAQAEAVSALFWLERPLATAMNKACSRQPDTGKDQRRNY